MEGTEARLFAVALWNCASLLEEAEGECFLGPPAYDRLTYGQKASLLFTIGNGLLKPDVPMCRLTAGVEAAIAAVFEYMKTAVSMENERQNSDWRKMILAVCRQTGAPDVPQVTCQDEDEWFDLIEHLSYFILWDYDFEDEDLYIDKPPEEAQVLKGFMDVDDDYFLEIPEDLKPKDIESRLSELKALCRSVCERTETI